MIKEIVTPYYSNLQDVPNTKVINFRRRNFYFWMLFIMTFQFWKLDILDNFHAKKKLGSVTSVPPLLIF